MSCCAYQLTLDEAITRYNYKANDKDICEPYRLENAQVAKWLEELRLLRLNGYDASALDRRVPTA